MDKKVVTELIQEALTPKNLKIELDIILHNEDRINQIKKDYGDLKRLLLQEGNASATAAQEIVGFLQKTAN
jgi:lipid A disaccharide synthetase